VGVPQSPPQTLSFGVGETDKTVAITVKGSYRISPTLGFTLNASRSDTGETAAGVGSIRNLNSTIVTNTNPTGYGSLFGAIQSSNQTPGPHTISFNVPTAGSVVIAVPSQLPPLTNPATNVLDATTQPGNGPVPRVTLDGAKIPGPAGGLVVLGGATTIRGLGISRFGGPGIVLDQAGNDTVDSCTIINTGQAGIAVRQASPHDRIIGNMILGAGAAGVRLFGSSGDVVSGNTIEDSNESGILIQNGSSGDLVSGNTILDSFESGILIQSGSAGITVTRNIVLGSVDGSGVRIEGGRGDVVTSNVLGAAGQGNYDDGVSVLGASGTVVGGTAPGAGNLIQANGLVGVRIAGAGATGNTVAGNTIGVGPGVVTGKGTAAAAGTAGATGQGNLNGGVFLDGATGNVIGGADPAARNLISGNGGPGVQVTQGGSNAILGNWIGVDSTGTAASGNAFDGVFLDRTSGNVVGSGQAGVGNVISGNGYVGVRVSGTSTAFNTIQGNRIGTNAAGTAAVGNVYDGVFITQGANHTLVGGLATAVGNLISGNGGVGVQIFGAGASANVVASNRVGTDASGLFAVPNQSEGVFVNAASGNAIGLPGAGNLLSGNVGSGLQLYTAGATGNTVQGNAIGLNSLGLPVLGNAVGIFLDAAGPNVLGGPGPAANTVAGNRSGQVVTTTPGGVAALRRV
jgi:parallel beta-helix repeat protein